MPEGYPGWTKRQGGKRAGAGRKYLPKTLDKKKEQALAAIERKAQGVRADLARQLGPAVVKLAGGVGLAVDLLLRKVEEGDKQAAMFLIDRALKLAGTGVLEERPAGVQAFIAKLQQFVVVVKDKKGPVEASLVESEGQDSPGVQVGFNG